MHTNMHTLSTHIIHINLNTILCIHIEHSPTKAAYRKYYIYNMETHTHIDHTDHAPHTHTHHTPHTHTHTHTVPHAHTHTHAYTHKTTHTHTHTH